jgi:hypothetical protein
MPRRFARGRLRLLGAIVLTVGALCAMAALAIARHHPHSHAVKGASYSGQIDNPPNDTFIHLDVSENGHQVGYFTEGEPGFDCKPPSVNAFSRAAHISRKGKFRGKIHYDGGATAIVKGRFHRHRRESGKLILKGAGDCNGRGHYSTKVQPVQ